MIQKSQLMRYVKMKSETLNILNFEGSEKYYDDGKQIWSLGRLDLFLTQNNFKKYMIKPIMAVQPDKSAKTLKSYYNKIIWTWKALKN